MIWNIPTILNSYNLWEMRLGMIFIASIFLLSFVFLNQKNFKDQKIIKTLYSYLCQTVSIFFSLLKTVSKPHPKEIIDLDFFKKTFGLKIKVSPPFLEKIEDNPIIRPITENSWESKLVFNPAAVYEEGKVHLVYRAVGDNDISVLGYAASDDGIYIIKRLKEPIYIPREEFESNYQPQKVYFASFISGAGCGGCEDPKITKIEDRFYMTYVAWNGVNLPRIALTSISVNDFLNHQWNWKRPVLISAPNVINKSCCLFPEKIKGKYVILHRVFPNILIDFVDNLNFDGKTKWLKGDFAIKPRANMWDSRKISAGAPPMKTKDGWLLIYHAADEHDCLKYKIGAMLLDLKNPARVLFRTNRPILEPTKHYENEGHKWGIVYPSGAVIVKNQLFVYYGGADAVVCVATANINKFLYQLKHYQISQTESMISPQKAIKYHD